MSYASPYVKIANFGKPQPILQTDPVGFSVSKDIDTSFDIGPTSRMFGPDMPNSQLYMAEKCARNWDGSCEFLSRNPDNTKCNAGKIQSPLFQSPQAPGMTIGDFLIENSAVRRFCDLSSCKMSSEPYNPLDPHSPMVTSYGDWNPYKQCMPVCMPPENPDNDLLLNKVLDDPDKHLDLLVNMYKNVKDRKKFEGTRIGMVFNVFDRHFKKQGGYTGYGYTGNTGYTGYTGNTGYTGAKR
jgi:hypothetical protein